MKHLRIFLASPSDVFDERLQASEVIEQLNREPLLSGKVTLELIAWDSPGNSAPMIVTMNPQEAIAAHLTQPSQCDIVVVIFWSKMGTPIDPSWETKPDVSHYRSGTEWEYYDALQAAESTGRPDILVYRCSLTPNLSQDDPSFDEKRSQWKAVEAFFAEFNNADGTKKRGINTYQTPSDLRNSLGNHLKTLIKKRLKSSFHQTRTKQSTKKNLACVSWAGLPYPGLRSFTHEEAPIFFGRELETDALVAKFANPNQRFIAVVGASGSGKTSLIAAGLLPRLVKGAIEGSQHWRWVRFSPGRLGDNPFLALASALIDGFPRCGWNPRDLAQQMPISDVLERVIADVLEEAPDWAVLLLIIDQFEELFTEVRDPLRTEFVALLESASTMQRVRIVITLRADFYQRCLEFEALVDLLNDGQYSLTAPNPGSLIKMITQPALVSGVTLDADLADRIVADTGTGPGALALMAYALSELFEASKESRHLRNDTYDQLGRVQGVIGRRAEAIFEQLGKTDPDIEVTLGRVFRDLVDVDDRGLATRKRATIAGFADPQAEELVSQLTKARLLVTSQRENAEPTIEVAHEAVLTHWPRLQNWISDSKADLQLLRQLHQASADWVASNRENAFLWPPRRVELIQAMCNRLNIVPTKIELEFLSRPEYGNSSLTDQEVNDLQMQFAVPLQFRLFQRGGDLTAKTDKTIWHQASVLFASEILKGGFPRFPTRFGPDSFWRLETVWLDEVKKSNAYLIWEQQHGMWPGNEMDDYVMACEHIRSALVDERMKSEIKEFSVVQSYIENRYLNEGRISLNSSGERNSLTIDLITTKAYRIHDTMLQCGATPDPMKSWLDTETFVKMFYENIISAVINSDEESTLMVLKALQYSNAKENHWAIINCLEAAIAIFFLKADLILQLWQNAQDELIPDSSLESVAQVDSWPKDFMVPTHLREAFFYHEGKIVFKGVMKNAHLQDLLSLLSDPGQIDAVNALFKRSRFILKETTL